MFVRGAWQAGRGRVVRGWRAYTTAAQARSSRPWVAAVAALTAGGAVVGSGLWVASSSDSNTAKERRVYRRSEVAEHGTVEQGVWVTFKDGVYDVTDFVANHPGGTAKIMLAAGGGVDAFWHIYQQHFKAEVQEILEKMRIGDLDPRDLHDDEADATDPYANDPKRHPALKLHNVKPCNAELPASLLLDHWITPSNLWFVRHHHPVPEIDEKSFEISVLGDGVRAGTLKLDDLKQRFKKQSIVATIQCGGNRRSDFNRTETTSGIAWDCGAISTAQFGGVFLRDVLADMGLDSAEAAAKAGVHHIQFESVDGMSASIPIEKAMNPYGDVLLAYEMNNERLPRDHGFPVRVIVPGHVGVRNVKWLSSVVASPEEAEGAWQRGIAYKGFGPNVKSFDQVNPEKVLSIQEQPVTSAILEPAPASTVEPGELVEVRGYAFSGGGRGIVRVDVSPDGGETWINAELKEGADQHPLRSWAWTFWSAEVEAPKSGTMQICAKATDASYNVQPESIGPIWNKRGLNNNAWPRVALPVNIE